MNFMRVSNAEDYKRKPAFLAGREEFSYTPGMHLINRRWTHLAPGHQRIRELAEKLTAEFGASVQAGHEQTYTRQLSEWQKKRRVFFAILIVAVLSLVTLCLTAFYFREVACVILYWAMLVVIILVTLGVALRRYLREMVDGKPLLQLQAGQVLDLEERWWASLADQQSDNPIQDNGGAERFLTLAALELPDYYVARKLNATEILLMERTQIWYFKILETGGVINKQGSAWKQRGRVQLTIGGKGKKDQVIHPAPDDEWTRTSKEIVTALETQQPWGPGYYYTVKGGIIFTNKKVKLDRKKISGNSAAYGKPKGWLKRVQAEEEAVGFTDLIQLKTLEAASLRSEEPGKSCLEEAQRIYEQARQELLAGTQPAPGGRVTG